MVAGKATAAIDISDGLVADVGHICDRSGLGAEIRLESLPVSDALSQVYPASEIETFALYGGDDYELCFSAPAHLRTQLEQAPFSLTRIGHMTTGGGAVVSWRQVISADRVGGLIILEDNSAMSNEGFQPRLAKVVRQPIHLMATDLPAGC